MIHHTCFHQLQEKAPKNALEDMVRASRTWLLKIPEVLAVRSGRNIDPTSKWHFFYSIEVGSAEKLKLVTEDGHYLKLHSQFIEPFCKECSMMDFELDPNRDLKYS